MDYLLELTSEENAEAWEKFYARFHFAPDYHERQEPAIVEPPPFVTFDLSSLSSQDELERLIDNVSRLFHEAYVAVVPSGSFLYDLDWHHTGYRYYPHLADSAVGWYPDGDYYVYLAEDFSFGTFGHPWQQSLCVFGTPLLERVELSLRGLLKVLRESPKTHV